MASLTDEDRRALAGLVVEGRLGAETLLRLLAPGTSHDLADRLGSILHVVEGWEADEAPADTVYDRDLDEADTLVRFAGQRPGWTRLEATLEEPTTPAGRLALDDTAPGADRVRDTFDSLPAVVLPGAESTSGEAPTSRYEIGQLLGRGGMGEVWLARDRTLGREVALKLLRFDVDPTEAVVRRFVHEARTTGSLAHPGVIPVHDAGQLPDGRWFYTMQRMPGRTLGDVLADLRRGEETVETAFPLPRLLNLFSQVCLTIAYVHDHGVIHRDLKPDNILLGDYGEVFVADWGLAKSYRPDSASGPSAAGERSRGTVIGTPQYMSPEQVRGDATLLPPSDVFSLGCILFEMLALELPFSADNPMRIMVRIATQAHRPDPRELAVRGRAVPSPMAELARQTLAIDPDERPTAHQLADRVSAYLDGVEEQRRRALLAEESLATARRRRKAFEERHATTQRARHQAEAAKVSLTLRATLDERRAVWGQLQRLDELAIEMDRLYSSTVQAANQSLGYRDTPEAHALLADLFWLKAREAERANDASNVELFESLVRQHDTGRYAELMSGKGQLRVGLGVLSDARVRLERQHPYGPLLVAKSVDLGGQQAVVSAGSYVLEVEAPGRMPVRMPLVVGSGESVVVDVDAPRTFQGSERFVYVAGGPAQLGGDERAPLSLVAQVVDIAPFLIGRYPVTIREYLVFLNDWVDRDPDEARSHAPRSTDGSVIWLDFDEGARRFRVPEADRDGDPWDPDWPVQMISWHDAVAYCRWRSAREGVAYRLPTELEWEKAARGVDGRIYPWGNGFDPTLCRMSDSVEGRALPVPVGSYPFDRSPYGVCDMAGLAMEWTETPDPRGADHYILRGGGIMSPADWCRAASRKGNKADATAIPFGFRVVRALT